MAIYYPLNRLELDLLIEDKTVELWNIDVSAITDMSYLFFKSLRKTYSGIEFWNTSNVINMSYMFSEAISFNENISNWNISKVENMQGMFLNAKSFNQPIGSWDVSKVIDMEWMFYGAENFNQDLSGWKIDIDKIIYLYDMFNNSPLAKNPPSWYYEL